MAVLVLATILGVSIGNIFILQKYSHSKISDPVLGFSITGIINAIVVTAALWIGLFTFRLFASQPF